MNLGSKISWFVYFFALTLLLPGTVISQSLLDQKIILSFEEASPLEIFDEIEMQFGIIISYSSNALDLDRKIVLSKREYSLDDLFKLLLENQDLIAYVRKNKILLIDNSKLGEGRSGNFIYRGYIRDSESGEVIVGATVYDPISLRGTETNKFGFFSIIVRSNQKNLVTSYVGYQAQLLEPKEELNNVDISLKPNPPISEIIVSEDLFDDYNEFERYKINYEDLDDLNGFFGEKDPIRALKLLPGVQSGNEAQGGVYVRGAGTEHNLVLMDGVTMYEINHAFNLSSVFNNDAINKVTFYKNGIPARFGGRLASVIDIKTKDGNYHDNKLSVTMDLLGVKVHSEGPIIKGRTSFNASARVSWLDLYLDPFIRKFTDFEETNINYYDFNLKLNHHFSPTSKLSVSSYIGNDKHLFKNDNNDLDNSDFIFQNINKLEWGNKIVNAQWSKVLSSKLFGKFSASFSTYTYTPRSQYSYNAIVDEIPEQFELDVIASSKLSDWNLSADFDYYKNNNNHFRFGASVIRHGYHPFVRQSDQILEDDLELIVDDENKTFANEYRVYAENDIRLSNDLNVNLGLNLTGFSIKNKTYYSLEPRLYLNYDYNKSSTLYLSFTSLSQNVHLLVNPGVGLPTDLWVPSTENIPPERSYNSSIGIHKKMGKNYGLSLMGYFNYYDNILEYRTPVDIFYTIINNIASPPVFSDNSDWESRIERGSSNSKGIEIKLTKRLSKLNAQIAYTLSKTDRSFDNLNGGEPFAYRYDRRHDLSMVGNYKFNENLSLSSTWIYGTGNAFTLALEEFISIQGLPVLDFEERNNFRMPPYHRLDLSLNYKKSLKKMKIETSFGIQNVYNRNNPFYIYLFQNPLTDEVSLKQVSIYPILPHFRFSISI